MKKRILAGFLALTLCLSLGASPVLAATQLSLQGGQQTQEPPYADGQAIVQLADTYSTVNRKAVAATLDIAGIKVVDTCNFKHTAEEKQSATVNGNKKSAVQQKFTTIALVQSDTMSTSTLLEELKGAATVKVAVPNYKTKVSSLTNDTYAEYQWALENTGQNGGIAGKDLNPDSIWDKGTTGSDKVVAVIDSGVDYTHEDLKDNMWVNPYKDKLPGDFGYDYCNKDAAPMDDSGHGTHCAGIIGAAGNNDAGISGIDQNVKIMAIKASDSDGRGDFYDDIQGYEYISDAQDLGIQVVAINNSYGLTGEDFSADDIAAIKELNQIFKELMDITGKKGAVSVCAAGNEASNNDKLPNCPSDAGSAWNITVAASDPSDMLAPYSNYGKQEVDIAAPGSFILSTVNRNTFMPGIYDKTKRQSLCSSYADYEEDTIGWGLPKVVSQQKSTISLDTTKFFNTGKQSLKLTFKDVKPEAPVLFEIPYELSDVNSDIHANVAVMGDVSKNGGWGTIMIYDKEVGYDTADLLEMEGNDYIAGAYADGSWWNLMFQTDAEKKSGNQSRKLIFAFTVRENGDYTINLDQLGISKENADPSQFGKYTFMDGTSMAAPYVAGAAALIAANDPGLSGLEVATTIKSSVRKVGSMGEKIRSGGVLDLSRLKKPQIVTSVKLNKLSAKVRKGTAFTLKATVSPSTAAEKNVTWKSSNTKVATVDKKGKVNAKNYGKAYITATSLGKGHKTARCLVTVGYKVTYKTKGGTLAKGSPKLYYNEKVVLKKPTRKGYTFAGWYAGGKKINSIKKGTKKNYVLSAKWKKILVERTYIKSISKKRSSKMTVAFKKIAGADGYQIKYSRSKNFSKDFSVQFNTTSVKKSINRLRKDTVYYVKVRAFRYDSAGKKVCGPYSETVRIR